LASFTEKYELWYKHLNSNSDLKQKK